MSAPVTPGTDRWNELRDESIARDGNRNWFLGDAALEIAPMGDHGGDRRSDQSYPGNTEANLRQFADEVGVEYASLRTYRAVAAAWPSAERKDASDHWINGKHYGPVSWKVHHMLMGHKHLIRWGMTVTMAHAALGHSTTGRTGPQAEPEDRATAAAVLLGDLTPAAADEFVNRLPSAAMETLAEAALRKEAAKHGVELQPRRTVPNPEPEYHRLTRRIAVDLVVVTGEINRLRADGHTADADRATTELREVLATGIARLEVIPDTIGGLTQ